MWACDSSQIQSSVEGFELEFSQSKSLYRDQVFTLSDQVYAGSSVCSVESRCLKVCSEIYSLEDDQKDCQKRKAQQIYQIEKLYNTLLKKNLSDLEDLSVFDLKVFFNIGAEPLFQFFKSLDLFSSKIFLNWIVLNWQVAKVFSEEDDQLLFFRIFLNKLGPLPINSLKEKIFKDRTFVELAWLKQNDFALLWMNSYFQRSQCLDLKEKELGKCMLAQYCLISDSFKRDVSEEIVNFKFIENLLEGGGSYRDFKAFCSDFCVSAKGQSYCG